MVKYSRQQVWEAIIIIILILFFLYRLGLAYDFIPREYQPSVMFAENYPRLKSDLLYESGQGGAAGYISKITLYWIESTEMYIKDKKAAYSQSAEVARRCNENEIYRFFMGSGSSTDCVERDLKLHHAITEDTSSEQAPSANPNN